MQGGEAAFADSGYHAANTHDICERSGVGIGTFYAHFEHKRQLLQKVIVERAPLTSRVLSAEDLIDRERLISRLQTVVDDRKMSRIWRAWHEAVLEDAEVSYFNAAWRAELIKELAVKVAAARALAGGTSRKQLAPSLVAWSILTLTRQLVIHDRRGAPDVPELAQIIHELVLGALDVA